MESKFWIAKLFSEVLTEDIMDKLIIPPNSILQDIKEAGVCTKENLWMELQLTLVG